MTSKAERIDEVKKEQYDEALYLTDRFIAEIGKLNRKTKRKICAIEEGGE